MHAVERNSILSNGKIRKKIDFKKFKKIEECQFDISVQKMHTGHEEKKYYSRINLKILEIKKMFLRDEKYITFIHDPIFSKTIRPISLFFHFLFFKKIFCVI